MIVALGRSLAQIPIALEMEFPPVIGRVTPRLRLGQQDIGSLAVAARLDRAEIGKEIDGPAQTGERIATPIRVFK